VNEKTASSSLFIAVTGLKTQWKTPTNFLQVSKWIFKI
jgi:hypothetical protein